MPELSLETAIWLTSAAARPPWEQALAEEAAGRTLVQIVQSLRRELSAEQAHAILEQVELCPKGRLKFTQADRMLFTRTGLQQATDEVLSKYKASRFPAGDRVADLCCGIGGDLLGLSARGPCRAIDRDAAILRLAEHNVAAAGGGDVLEFIAAEIQPQHVADCAAWHLDPDRRPTGRRTVQLEFFSPNLETIAELRTANPHAALKLAPASEIPADWEEDVEREWISREGECRQQVVWCGHLARSAGQARATVFGNGHHSPRSLTGVREAAIPVATELGSYLFEPDAAILAAQLTGALATQLQLHAIAAGSVYLTGNAQLTDPAVACFAIRDVLPFDRRRLKSYFRERHVGRLEIKKRGVDLEPEKLRKTLDLQGENAATLIVTPHGQQTIAIIAERT